LFVAFELLLSVFYILVAVVSLVTNATVYMGIASKSEFFTKQVR